MGFDEEDNNIIFLFLEAPGFTNLLSVLPKSQRQSMWVKPWLQRRSTKNVYHSIISEPKLQDSFYPKIFLKKY